MPLLLPGLDTSAAQHPAAMGGGHEVQYRQGGDSHGFMANGNAARYGNMRMFSSNDQMYRKPDHEAVQPLRNPSLREYRPTEEVTLLAASSEHTGVEAVFNPGCLPTVQDTVLPPPIRTWLHRFPPPEGAHHEGITPNSYSGVPSAHSLPPLLRPLSVACAAYAYPASDTARQSPLHTAAHSPSPTRPRRLLASSSARDRPRSSASNMPSSWLAQFSSNPGPLQPGADQNPGPSAGLNMFAPRAAAGPPPAHAPMPAQAAAERTAERPKGERRSKASKAQAAPPPK